MTSEIQQAAAAVQMLEMMVRAGRASWNELQQAKDRLAALRSAFEKPKITVVAAPVLEKITEPATLIDGEELASIQAELSKEADRLNRQMAEVSNKLADVPTSTPCPELCSIILDLKDQIERIWDKKRFLERNQHLPEEEPTTDMRETSPEKFALAYQKRRLVDLRSKLKKKLEDPKASESRRHKWETELLQTNLEIREIDVKLGTL